MPEVNGYKTIPEKILAPINFSSSSHEALEQASALAEQDSGCNRPRGYRSRGGFNARTHRLTSDGVWLDCGEADQAGSHSAAADSHRKAREHDQGYQWTLDGMVVS
jgi:hypothetical protein